jgi:pimeloyl-ACP methyl ester carboxylesterase
VQRLDTRVIRLADGRDLAWVELGDPEGAPLYIFHGAPGSAGQFVPVSGAAADAHVRLLSLDRPGYGRSSYHRARTFADFAGDVAQLADHLELDTFAVAGHSSGGPHAAACARFLPRRVTACGIISGPAPSVRLDDPRRTEGMMVNNRVVNAVCRRWPESWDPVAVGLWIVLLRPLVATALARSRKNPERAIDQFLSKLPAPDDEMMARPEIRESLLEEIRHLSADFGRTAMQDMAIGVRDWGFRLEDITVPVHLWHGDRDRNIPIAQGELQAELIPNATLHRCPGEAHATYVTHMREILETLTGAPATTGRV